MEIIETLRPFATIADRWDVQDDGKALPRPRRVVSVALDDCRRARALMRKLQDTPG